MGIVKVPLNLDDILTKTFTKTKTFEGHTLNREDLISLIAPANQEQRDKIQAAARKMRQLHTGDIIYTSGFVYFSTWCRNDCHFCGYRLSSKTARRYRKTPEEVLEAARLLARQGVNNIDLTLGEDPAIDRPEFSDQLARLISEVKQDTGLPVMISPGVIKPEILHKFRQAGADFYACYQETYNRELFNSLRQGQCFDTRLGIKTEALKAGFLVEEGVLCGVGETVADLADSILGMIALGAQQVRAMGFVPPAEALAEGGDHWTPSPSPGESRLREVDMIAALRLARPNCLIPASLDVEGLGGLKVRLEAGANLITSLVPADLALSGVAQASLDIDNQARSIEGIRPVVEELGLRLATPAQYQNWIDTARPKS